MADFTKEYSYTSTYKDALHKLMYSQRFFKQDILTDPRVHQIKAFHLQLDSNNASFKLLPMKTFLSTTYNELLSFKKVKEKNTPLPKNGLLFFLSRLHERIDYYSSKKLPALSWEWTWSNMFIPGTTMHEYLSWGKMHDRSYKGNMSHSYS